MKRALDEEEPDNWLLEINQKYNVGHEDFTQFHPKGIVVYRGSNLPPEIVFRDGFRRSTESIWIEDSRYLLQGPWAASSYVAQQCQMNRTVFTDQEFGQIVAPGANRGLISTTLSPKKAAWYAALSFLEKAKAKANNNYSDVPDHHQMKFQMCADYLGGYLSRSSEIEVPIGYVYAVRITQAINISAHFQWADFQDPDLIEQEMACLEIPANDVMYLRPVFMKFVPGKAFVCTLGPIMENPALSATLTPELPFPAAPDDALQKYKTLEEIGSIGLARNQGFMFSYDRSQCLRLDDTEFSKTLIKSVISPDRKTYLEKLRARIKPVEDDFTNLLKTDEGQNDKDEFGWGFEEGGWSP